MEESSSTLTGNGATSTDVKADVKEKAGEVKGEVSAQAKEVARQASDHARDLADRARRDARDQAQARTAQAAGGLRTLSSQIDALAHGDTDQAGPLADYLRDAGDRVSSFAGRLDEGPDAVLADLRSFARRRPLVFLGAAGVLGFAAGRLLRSGIAVAREESEQEDQTSVFSAPPTAATPLSAVTAGAPPVEPGPLGSAPTAGMPTAGMPTGVNRP